MRQLLSLVFGRAGGHQVRTAENGRRALELLRQEPADLIISDVKMPDMSGIELLRAVRGFLPDAGVVMMTAFATVETAREAFKLGADDFIQKPFDVDELKLIAERALDKLRLKRENETLKSENEALLKGQHERGQLGNIIGHSSRMQAVYQMIETVAAVQSTVLITGESGTGKEILARAIHEFSDRALTIPSSPSTARPSPATCSKVKTLGHRRGAFTGATANRKGLFEASDKGTIFLDEIGEMSPTMQVKLLRVLQERKVRPVGAHEETAVDARVIAATNRDLAQMVKQGAFREDLYYRISVIPIELPPLREKREDIADLVAHFVEKYCAQTGRALRVSERAMELLEGYAWPGNVRELEHTIERAVALERTDTIQPESLPQGVTNYNPARHAPSDYDLPAEGLNLVAHLEHLEKNYVLEALRQTGGNQTRAAELLHMPVRSLRHLLDKHGIRSLTAQLRSDAAGRGASEG